MKDYDFTWPDTTRQPPLVKTNQTPADIVGPHTELVKMHHSLSKKCFSTEDHEKTMKKFTAKERATIAEIYQDLRDNGYYITDQDEAGRLVIAVVTSENQMNREFSKEEIAQAKKDFKKFIAKGM